MATALSQRPARTYVTGKTTGSIRVATIALSIFSTLVMLVSYSALPETTPTHFNFIGEADSWGSKNSLWGLLIMNLLIPAGLALLSKHPRVFNYPALLTVDNAQILYRAGEQMIVWIGAFCAIIFSGICASIIFDFNPSVILVPAMIGVFASLIVGLARMIKI